MDMVSSSPRRVSSHSHERFKKAREDNALELAADYLELIQDLIEEFGEARATDLADRLGVSQVTAYKGLQRLVREGYIEYRPYRSIFLTATGKALAELSKDRHKVVLKFLLSLGVSAAVAEADAEGLEHHLSPETLDALKRFVNC